MWGTALAFQPWEERVCGSVSLEVKQGRGAPKRCLAGKWWTLGVGGPDTPSKGPQTQAGDPDALGAVPSQES